MIIYINIINIYKISLMGSFLEFTDENVKPYTTREQNFDEEFIKNPDNENIIEYYNFCKGLIFVDGKSIKVNVDQKFAVEYLANHTIPKQRKNTPSYKSKDEAIELVENKTFYPHEMSYKGGNSNHIYVFKATKKGKFKINFTTYKITVIVE